MESSKKFLRVESLRNFTLYTLGILQSRLYIAHYSLLTVSLLMFRTFSTLQLQTHICQEECQTGSSSYLSFTIYTMKSPIRYRSYIIQSIYYSYNEIPIRYRAFIRKYRVCYKPKSLLQYLSRLSVLDFLLHSPHMAGETKHKDQ